MTKINRQIVLASRPQGLPREENFREVHTPLRALEEGEFLVRNLFISLDAGFRNWMNEGSGDNILPAMPLDAAVMGLTLGEVVESRHAAYSVGDVLMARLAWEEYSITDGADFDNPLSGDLASPLSLYLGMLGDTGLSAYFGLMDIGKPKEGETVLVSAAGGAVGSVAGQIAKILGARVVGITSSDDKCQHIIDDLGYDAAINRRASGALADNIRSACPAGVDVYFDSIGGSMLEAALENINAGARVVLCGAISTYGTESPPPGPNNLFQLVTKQALMQGFMCHFNLERYDEARTQLIEWMNAGKLRNVEYMLDGIENTATAFCQMFRGENYGKTIIKLA